MVSAPCRQSKGTVRESLDSHECSTGVLWVNRGETRK